jgi:nucleoside-diphosphate-sugar epimerase
MTILVTGSEGLIGANLIPRLLMKGASVRAFDVRRSQHEDTRDPSALANVFEHGQIAGVVHLAAVSRVVWAEQDPEKCEATNVRALNTLLALCARQRQPPWLIFASSREVYGNRKHFPVSESAPFDPINTYGRSKVEGERLIAAARASGLVANVCRFSSVYGWPFDHANRVSMAFATAAAHGGDITLEGSHNVFDFTFIDDVIDGLLSLIEVTSAGAALPPVHFVSGTGTSLEELADIAVAHSPHAIELREAPARTFDVGHFVGDPERAASLLGWRAQTPVHVGLPKLIERIVAAGPAHAPPTLIPAATAAVAVATSQAARAAGS